MAVTTNDIKKKIAEYLSQAKPEPHLAFQFPDSITLEAIDFLKESGAVWQRNFWILSRDNAKKSLLPPQINWQAHWQDEKKRMAERMSKRV